MSLNDPRVMMLLDAIFDFGALVLFYTIVLTAYGMLMLAILFCALAVRTAWRWLATHTWGDVIFAVHRRALR